MKLMETLTLFDAVCVRQSSPEAAQVVRSLQPTRVNPARSFGRGRPKAGPKLGDLTQPILLQIFDSILLAGWLGDRPFRAELLCVDGDASQQHWVHTTEGRVRLSPSDRQRLFDVWGTHER